MIIQIDKDRFNSLMSEAVAFNHVIGSLVFTEVVKLGRTIAICIGEGDAQRFFGAKE